MLFDHVIPRLEAEIHKSSIDVFENQCELRTAIWLQRKKRKLVCGLTVGRVPRLEQFSDTFRALISGVMTDEGPVIYMHPIDRAISKL